MTTTVALLDFNNAAIASLTPNNVADVRSVRVSIIDDDHRAYLRSILDQDTLACYVDRANNWADFRVTTVPQDIGDGDATATFGVSGLAHGDGLKLDGEFALGFSPASATGGWSPEFAVAEDGDRRALEVVDWHGGTGVKPDVDQYLGADGFVDDIADAVDIRGAPALVNNDDFTVAP